MSSAYLPPGPGFVRRLQSLLEYPREDLARELKGWLDLSVEESKANIAKAILALANYGGGYITIGFTRDNGNWMPAQPRPSDLSIYAQDIVNGIIRSYAEPVFHCDVHHIPHPINGDVFPIIIVPGRHRTPIRAKRAGPNQRHVRINTYYTRRPGPSSEAIQTAQEWDELINRCMRNAKEDLLNNIREILLGKPEIVTPEEEQRTISGKPEIVTPEEEEIKRLDVWTRESTDRFASLVHEQLPQEVPSRYSHGTWTVAYSIMGNTTPQSRKDLLSLLSSVEGRETGWPPWLTHLNVARPYPYNGVVECWMKDTMSRDAAHSDFWRASPEGMMYLLRGYEEDSTTDFAPGTILDLTLPVWRVGECLLHAERLASKLADKPASVRFHVIWSGLRGRILRPWASRRILHEELRATQESVASDMQVPSDRISPALPEIVNRLTRPLYEVFDFFRVPMQMIQEELSEMSKLKF